MSRRHPVVKAKSDEHGVDASLCINVIRDNDRPPRAVVIRATAIGEAANSRLSIFYDGIWYGAMKLRDPHDGQYTSPWIEGFAVPKKLDPHAIGLELSDPYAYDHARRVIKVMGSFSQFGLQRYYDDPYEYLAARLLGLAAALDCRRMRVGGVNEQFTEVPVSTEEESIDTQIRLLAKLLVP